MRGISHKICILSSQPSLEQIVIYMNLIRSLRHLDYEHIVFEFKDADQMHGDEYELAFYQMCVDHDDILHVEICIGSSDDWLMYGKECTVDEAINLFCELNGTRKVPVLDSWKDITDIVLEDIYDESEDRIDED